MMFKKVLLTKVSPLMIVLLIASCGGQKAETETEETSETEVVTEQTEEAAPTIESPRKQAEGKIGEVNVILDYGSPAVKGREIWGGLEPYGEVWRAGANETTSIQFDKDVAIGGTEVKAGKYGVYIIPNESEDWVIIFNTDWNREEHGAWGAYNYTQDHDVARISVPIEQVEDNQERLEYTIAAEGFGFAWEKVRLMVPIKAG
ncbi:MAG: DUF2911 domain-containing protein [Bacteroidota bacterium]